MQPSCYRGGDKMRPGAGSPGSTTEILHGEPGHHVSLGCGLVSTPAAGE